jgi:hypothetical protein
VLANFTDYQFENLGYVRLPCIILTKEQKTNVGCGADSNNLDYLKAVTFKGLQKRLADGVIPKDKYDEYEQKAKDELNIFERNGLVDYILAVYDFLSWCDDNNIPRGVGRGSSAGSVVLYALRCTNVDPLKHNLYFTRFINEARLKSKTIDGVLQVSGATAPDIDSDISYRDRDKVIKYLEEKYKGKTAFISTNTTLSGKLVLKEVTKIVLGYSEEEAKQVAANIESHFGTNETLEEAYKNSKDFKIWADKNKRAFEIAQSLELLIKNRSKHPSGMAISYYDLNDSMPLELSSSKDVVTSYDMYEVANLLIKFDILGLKNCDVNYDVCKMVGVNQDTIDINHPSIYEYLNNNTNYYGLFQIESGLTKQVVVDVKPKNIDQLAVCVAISRPGAFAHIDKYIKYLHGGILESIYPPIDEILKETGNVLIFQEQINRVCQEVYGMSGIDADSIRYCITGDTYFISKSRGYITINELLTEGYKDDNFLVMDENGKQSWQKIKEIWSTGKHNVRNVTAKNGMNVRATEHHQFLTDNGWKTQHWLKQDNDYLVCTNKVDFRGEDKISPSLSIVMAGVITEGYFNRKNGFTFTNYNKYLMDIFCDNAKRVFDDDYPKFHNDKKVARFVKKHSELLSKYLKLGKSADKILPSAMMGMTLETTRNFLSFM